MILQVGHCLEWMIAEVKQDLAILQVDHCLEWMIAEVKQDLAIF